MSTGRDILAELGGGKKDGGASRANEERERHYPWARRPKQEESDERERTDRSVYLSRYARKVG